MNYASYGIGSTLTSPEVFVRVGAELQTDRGEHELNGRVLTRSLFTSRTYLDASYVAKSIVEGLDLRFSAMNLLNDTEPVGMVINNGAFHPRGRSIGVQLSARF